MDDTRDEIVNHPTVEDPIAHAWQIERIREGVEAARAGRTAPAENVFASIAIKHGWSL